jgi:Flp pilus assembly pilin Flp
MMQYVRVMLTAVMRDRKGVSSLEYVVLAVGIITAITLGVTDLGKSLSSAFANIIADLGTATKG